MFGFQALRLWRASTSCGCKPPGHGQRWTVLRATCNLETKFGVAPKLKTCQMLPQILMALEQSSWMLSLGNTLCMSPSMCVWSQPNDWHITNPPNPLAFFQKWLLLQNPENNTVSLCYLSRFARLIFQSDVLSEILAWCKWSEKILKPSWDSWPSLAQLVNGFYALGQSSSM